MATITDYWNSFLIDFLFDEHELRQDKIVRLKWGEGCVVWRDSAYFRSRLEDWEEKF